MAQMRARVGPLNDLTTSKPAVLYSAGLPKWRNWQTRYVQGVVGVLPSGFESPLRHRSPLDGPFLNSETALLLPEAGPRAAIGAATRESQAYCTPAGTGWPHVGHVPLGNPCAAPSRERLRLPVARDCHCRNARRARRGQTRVQSFG